MSVELIKSALRSIPDFPKPGILFKDITPVLSDEKVFKMVIDLMAEPYKNNKPTKIVGLESRGFVFGVALAYKLGIGFVPIRKKGKLPYKTYEASYQFEYGSSSIEIHQDALTEKDRVVIVDDLLATGGTMAAAIELINKLKAKILGLEFLIELKNLNGRDKIKGYNTNSIAIY